MNLYIDKIDNYEEPRKQIEQKMDFTRHAPEMTMPESAFLCGLIRKHRPEKIIEVGVSGGGDISCHYAVPAQPGNPRGAAFSGFFGKVL